MSVVSADTDEARDAASKPLDSRLVYLISFLGGLLVWQLFASALPGAIFASPIQVAQKLAAGFADGTIPLAFAGSLQQFVIGFAIAFAIALPVGFLMGRNRTAYMMFDPIVNAMFSIPSVGFVPFIMIWFGLFLEARIALVVLMSVFDMTVTIAAGARHIDPALISVGRSFGYRGWSLLRKVLIPASVPFVLTAARIGLVRAVNAMITAELFFASVNLGGIMHAASSRFDAATMLGIVFLVSLFGLLVQQSLKLVEAKFVPWHTTRG